MRRAVFAGSFDPVTMGHIDIVERAASMFDELIVCIFHNVQKDGCFPLEERMKQQNAHVVVRGLRSVKDFEYEENHAAMVRHLMPESDTIFLLTRPDLTFVSSSGVRELIRFRGPVQGIVPPSVERAILKLYGKKLPLG